MTKFGAALIGSLTEALAHAAGEASAMRVHTVAVPDADGGKSAPSSPTKRPIPSP